jgi:choline dehydrogenase-like flavoprotein
VVRRQRQGISAAGPLLRRRRHEDVRRGLYRLRKEDFGELRHYDGISPAWPISYEEMEPFYTKAEQMYQVHGLRGVDPTEPPRARPYPYPPVSHEPRMQQLFNDLNAAGFHPFQAPCGIMLDEQHMENSRCIRCQTCDGFPCLVHAKSDAEVLGVRPALQYPNVTLLRNSQVVRLLTNASGRSVKEVIVSAMAKRSRSSATSSCSLAVLPIPRSCY